MNKKLAQTFLSVNTYSLTLVCECLFINSCLCLFLLTGNSFLPKLIDTKELFGLYVFF